ncbi:hypothetical protein D3C80_2168140 [compost metagenome]
MQSATNAGHITSSFFTPALANSSRRVSVYGSIHLARPNRDWNDTDHLPSAMPIFCANALAVARHWPR